MAPISKDRIVNFLNHQRGAKPGYFKFSYSGDLYGENDRWGLGASAFAAKLYQMLGLVDSMDAEYKKQWVAHIKSFENEQGEIYDPLVVAKSSIPNKLSAFRRGYFGNFFNQEVRRAETRQSQATLEILGSKPTHPYALVPRDIKGIDRFLDRLNWRSNPWNAASHAGQLISFYARDSRWFDRHQVDLFEYAMRKINQRQSADDGSWHTNPALPNNVRVNAAMKIITGLVAAGRQTELKRADKLIDLCLGGSPDGEACSNVDRIYVLYYASRLSDHRSSEIHAFAQKKLKQYEENFRPEGGFSFFPQKAQDRYYGAKITKGLNEPDLQGTALSMWGVVLLIYLLDLPERKEFKMPII